MTEQEWLTSANTTKLKKFLGRPLSRRKCLLAVCGYGRHIEQHIPAAEVIDYLVRCETGADADPIFSLPFEEVVDQRYEFERRYRVNTPPYGICYGFLSALHTSASERMYIGGT